MCQAPRAVLYIIEIHKLLRPPKAGLDFDDWLRRHPASELALSFSCDLLNFLKAQGLVAVWKNETLWEVKTACSQEMIGNHNGIFLTHQNENLRRSVNVVRTV